MKTIHSLLTAALVALSLSAHALTLPVSEDTSTTTNAKLAKSAGKATTLPLTASRSALVRFEVGAFGGTIASSDVTAARLVLYIGKAKVPGDLTLHAVTSAWSEVFTTPLVVPTIDAAVLATITAPNVVAKQFVIVDVTTQVKAWLATPASDFGFAIQANGTTNVLLGSKEGSAAGYPATLEIDTPSAISSLDGALLADGSVSSAKLASNLGLGGTTTGTFSGMGSALTGLNATNIGSGTLADARLSSNVALRDAANTFTAANVFNAAGNSFTGDGAGLTSLAAASLTGTVADARLSSNVALRNAANTFTADQTISTTTQQPLLVTSDNTNGTPIGLDNTSAGGRHWSLVSSGSGSAGGAGKLLIRDEDAGAVRMTFSTTGDAMFSSQLTVNGPVFAQSFVQTSDARFKLDVQPVAGALGTVMRLRGVTYEWNRAAFPDGGFSDRRQLGFIAQEVREVLPDIVSENRDGCLAVGYTAIIPVLTEAMKELRTEKDTEIARLNAKLAEAEARLERLERVLESAPARAVRASLK